MRAMLLALLLPLVASSCSGQEVTGFTPADAEVRILFIGNSLTYTHDVPGLVGSLGQRLGRSVAVARMTGPNMALEDHWHSGLPTGLARLRPTVVVLQQGPSSLPESRTELVRWARNFEPAIRAAGAVPALYMVWPESTRRDAFAAVETSYALAAESIDGVLLPAGTTWLEAWARDAALPLYGPDGFHQSYLGAYAAALTIAAVLFDADPAALPALEGVSAASASTLRAAVAASLARWR